MNNPFETLDKRLSNIEDLLLDIKHKPKEDLSNKRYDLKEAEKITGLTSQSLRIKIKKGIIKGEQLGRKYYILHNDLYDAFNKVKSLKYRRDV